MDADKGKTDWAQSIVRYEDHAADYISMAGRKYEAANRADLPHLLVRRLRPDPLPYRRAELFVATKGCPVQVPYRNIYWMETRAANRAYGWKWCAPTGPLLYRRDPKRPGPAPDCQGQEPHVLASYRTPPDPMTRNKASPIWISGAIS